MSYVPPEAPTPLFRPLRRSAPRPRFPDPAIENAIRAIETLTQAPDVIAMQSVLAAISIAAQGLADVETLGGKAPLSLYLLTVARSGERKSGCDGLASTAIVEVERRRTVAFKRELARQAEKASAVVEEDADSPSREDPPMDPAILFADVTFEAVLEHFARGNPSIGLKSDDAGQFFGGYSMKKENRLKTAAGLSRLWDGQAIDRHRVGSGSIRLPGRRASVHFMLQPAVAHAIVTDPTFIDQGLLARFLIAWPDSRVGYRTIDDIDAYQAAVAEAQQHMAAFDRRIQSLLNLPLKTASHDRKELDPRFLSLTDEAREVLCDFYNSTEIAQREGEAFEHISDFASKIAQQACRIAGLLTLFADEAATEVSLPAMKAGVALAEWYLAEMSRLRECGLVSPEYRNAERLRQWLISRRLGASVTPRDIVRNGPSPAFSSAEVKRLMAILAENGWVIPLAKGTVVDGRQARVAWRVVSATAGSEDQA